MNVISLPIKVGAVIPVCISNTVEALNLYWEKSVQGATQEAGAPWVQEPFYKLTSEVLQCNPKLAFRMLLWDIWQCEGVLLWLA